MVIPINPSSSATEILNLCHEYTALPSLIFSWVFFAISLIIVGAFFKSEDSNWGRFFAIWFLTVLISGIFIFWLAFSPNAVQYLWNFFKDIF